MRYAAALLLLGIIACSSRRDPALAEMAGKLTEATPAGDRAGVAAETDALLLLDRDGKLGGAERRALADLYESAIKDGSIDDDERAVLTHLVRDVVAGGGSVKR